MNPTNSLIVPQKRSALPLLLGLLIGSASLAYGVARWQRAEARSEHGGAALAERGDDRAATNRHEGAAATPAPPPSEEPGAEGAASTGGGATAVSGGEAKPAEGKPPEGKGDGKGGEAKPSTVTIKMEPLIANLDEGDQLRYLKVSVQLEVASEAQPKAQSAMPRARHEALLYMSGLHLSDVQGMLGKQRVHRELQRRIADAIGGGLKRIYFDEFVVQ